MKLFTSTFSFFFIDESLKKNALSISVYQIATITGWVRIYYITVMKQRPLGGLKEDGNKQYHVLYCIVLCLFYCTEYNCSN